MIDVKEFNLMRKDVLKFDSQREKLIKKSRDVLKLSKQVIYALHRSEIKVAEKLIIKIKKELKALNRYVKANTKMYHEGSYKVAVQEYVEAMLFHSYVKHRKLATRKELGVRTDYYLLGLADLPGELVRRAILDSTKGNTKSPIEAKEIVSDIYAWLLKFDIRNGELRKKFDGIKYDLRKLEDLCFQLSQK